MVTLLERTREQQKAAFSSGAAACASESARKRNQLPTPRLANRANQGLHAPSKLHHIIDVVSFASMWTIRSSMRAVNLYAAKPQSAASRACVGTPEQQLHRHRPSLQALCRDHVLPSSPALITWAVSILSRRVTVSADNRCVRFVKKKGGGGGGVNS